MLTSLLSSTVQPAVEHELFLLGHRNLRAHVFGQVGLSMLVVWGAWGTVPATRALLWLLWMLCFAVVMQTVFAWFQAKAASPDPRSNILRQWRWANFCLLAVAGFAWGSLGWLFVPGAQVNNLMVMTSFAGALAYSAASNAHDLRAFYSSIGVGTATLLVEIPMAYGDQYGSVSGMCLLYALVLSMVARNSHKTLIASIELRLENELLAKTNAEHAALAEKANQDKSEFLAAASHDLRQPVHALLLLIEAYRQSNPVAAKDPLIEQIAIAGKSVGALFNALMELSRLESGTERVSMESVKLFDFVHAAIERVRPEAQRKSLQMRWHGSAKLDGDLAVQTDRVLLERILGNLLSNAVRYTDRGGILVALRLAPGSSGLWLEVWDTGIGIASSEQARIFDPYVQIGNRERDRAKGLGLGLAIVRTATGLLGLRVQLQSRPHRGSCFRLEIPATLLLRALPKPAEEVPPSAVSAQGARLAGRRLLVVDDDPMVMQAMQALLGSWQVDLRWAVEGNTSVLSACEPGWEPECIISDFRLPGPLNGIELLDQLLERFPKAVGILQTGELVQNVQTQAEDAGYLVLFKPVLPAVLVQTLCTVLEIEALEARA